MRSGREEKKRFLNHQPFYVWKNKNKNDSVESVSSIRASASITLWVHFSKFEKCILPIAKKTANHFRVRSGGCCRVQAFRLHWSCRTNVHRSYYFSWTPTLSQADRCISTATHPYFMSCMYQHTHTRCKHRAHTRITEWLARFFSHRHTDMRRSRENVAPTWTGRHKHTNPNIKTQNEFALFLLICAIGEACAVFVCAYVCVCLSVYCLLLRVIISFSNRSAFSCILSCTPSKT